MYLCRYILYIWKFNLAPGCVCSLYQKNCFEMLKKIDKKSYMYIFGVFYGTIY
jgi:hypothetical protein